MVKQYKQWWKIKTANEEGKDYQEDGLNRERLCSYLILFVFIGPESDHWQCLSVTHSLTHSCLVDLIDVTLGCEDAHSKLVEVVTVANASDEDCVGNRLLQI